MSTIGILLIVLALLLEDYAQLRRIVGGWRYSRLERRFGRLVPRGADASTGARSDGDGLLGIVKLLRALDPSFLPMEDALRGLGHTSLQLVLVSEGVKLLTALVLAVMAGLFAPPDGPYRGLLVGLAMFVASIAGMTQLIKGAVRRRRRQLGRELIAGIDLLTIFLQGGQSLEQAFRALADVAGAALPALAAIQRSLMADIDNGASFEKALDRWAAGIGSEPAQVLATLFKETLLHGTELVPQLRRFSTDLLDRRLIEARESIGRKSAQLTVVMVLFFLPAILLFMGGPAIVGLVSSLRTMQ